MLNLIHYIDNVSTPDDVIVRKITSIKGAPFYQSSGKASTHPGTWFPFYGIQECASAFCKKGAFIKPFSALMDEIFAPLLVKHFPKSPYLNPMLHQRFGSVEALLISSWLGGGLWESEGGRALKAKLTECYPAFYHQLPAPTFKNPEHTFNTLQDKKVNQWLCQKADVKSIQNIDYDLIKNAIAKINAPKQPKTVIFNYQTNRTNLGSKTNHKGERRSARLAR